MRVFSCTHYVWRFELRRALGYAQYFRGVALRILESTRYLALIFLQARDTAKIGAYDVVRMSRYRENCEPKSMRELSEYNGSVPIIHFVVTAYGVLHDHAVTEVTAVCEDGMFF